LASTIQQNTMQTVQVKKANMGDPSPPQKRLSGVRYESLQAKIKNKVSEFNIHSVKPVLLTWQTTPVSKTSVRATTTIQLNITQICSKKSVVSSTMPLFRRARTSSCRQEASYQIEKLLLSSPLICLTAPTTILL